MSNVITVVAGMAMAVVPNYVAILVLRAVYGFSVKGGWVAIYVLRNVQRSCFRLLIFLFKSGLALIVCRFCCFSDWNRWSRVQAHSGHLVSDVLQHWAPHPPSPRLLHHWLALAAGCNYGTVCPLYCLLQVINYRFFYPSCNKWPAPQRLGYRGSRFEMFIKINFHITPIIDSNSIAKTQY